MDQVLELCDDVQRELLLSRVRLQLHALKKYTYGKHIVARVEKLLATGTKMQSSSSNKLPLGAAGHPLPDDSELQALRQRLAAEARVSAAATAETPPKDAERKRVSCEAGASTK